MYLIISYYYDGYKILFIINWLLIFLYFKFNAQNLKDKYFII